jgi:hypothetical protein
VLAPHALAHVHDVREELRPVARRGEDLVAQPFETRAQRRIARAGAGARERPGAPTSTRA